MEPTQPTEPIEPAVRFESTFGRGDRLRIGAAIGAVLFAVFAVSAALAASPSPSASGAPAPTAGGTKPFQLPGGFGFGIGPNGAGPAFRGPFGFGGGPAGGGQLGGGPAGGGPRGGSVVGPITISAIAGSNVTLTTADGWTRTIAVTDAVKITRGGATATLSDLKTGDQVRIGQTKASDGTYTVTSLEVILPTVAGAVTDVSADGFTVKRRDGTTQKVVVTGSTSYRLGTASGTKSDVTVGSTVIVSGTNASDGSLSAIRVQVIPPVVVGEVTAKTASTITLKRRDGTDLTIHVSGSTTYALAGVTSPGLDNVTVGLTLVVEGTQRSDGSLDAISIRGGDFKGQPGGRAFPFGPGPKPTPGATSAPG